jgi:hypothetical protein
LTPYPFNKLSDLSFEFETSKGITYYAYFVEYGFMFDNYPELSKNIYSFNLDVRGDWQFSKSDDRIGLTVVEIFRRFFFSNQNVAIYVCDSLDDRHLARKRKFDFWFWKFNNKGEILKEDGLAVIDGTEIYNSVLVHKGNNNANQIFQAFRTLNQRASDK